MNALRPGFNLYPGMRVGLFGGSFNPAHDGHAHVAGAARKALDLDKVLWLVSPQNPLKDRRETASLARRIDATRKVATRPSDIVTDIESRLGSAYTAHTLRWFKRRYPGVRFVWIMGSDNLYGLHRWRAWRDLARENDIAVVPRPGAGARAQLAPGGRYLRRTGRTRFLETPLVSASSTALRVRAMASG
jgi:nicotinate-nucleotide adenylyltransferase